MSDSGKLAGLPLDSLAAALAKVDVDLRPRLLRQTAKWMWTQFDDTDDSAAEWLDALVKKQKRVTDWNSLLSQAKSARGSARQLDSPLGVSDRIRTLAWEGYFEMALAALSSQELPEPTPAQLIHLLTGTDREAVPDLDFEKTTARRWSSLLIGSVTDPRVPAWSALLALAYLKFSPTVANRSLMDLLRGEWGEKEEELLAIWKVANGSRKLAPSTLILTEDSDSIADEWLPEGDSPSMVLSAAEILEFYERLSELSPDFVQRGSLIDFLLESGLRFERCVVELPGSDSIVERAASQHPAIFLSQRTRLTKRAALHLQSLPLRWAYLLPALQSAPSDNAYPFVPAPRGLSHVLARASATAS